MCHVAQSFASLRLLIRPHREWNGASDLRDGPQPSAIAVHVNKRCSVAKVDDNGGAGANMSYQLPRKRSIVLYLVHTCYLVLSKLSEALRRVPGLSD